MLDVVIVGGGPAGLSSALVFGRACRTVGLFDAGTPRNAAAEQVRGYLGRDGTPPAELRRIARAELAAYDTVAIHDAWVQRIEPAGFAFRIRAGDGTFMARRVLLCAGVVDDLPEAYRDLWGKCVFQCPYCHGFEVRDRPFGYLAKSPRDLEHGLLLRAWTRDLVVLTGGAFEVPPHRRNEFEHAQVPLEERRITGLRSDGDRLAAVKLEGDAEVEREFLFAHPDQHQTALVTALKLALDAHGSIVVDEHYETSVPGIHAAGDVMSSIHSAVVAAGSAASAAYRVNQAVTLERLVQGAL